MDCQSSKPGPERLEVVVAHRARVRDSLVLPARPSANGPIQSSRRARRGLFRSWL